MSTDNSTEIAAPGSHAPPSRALVVGDGAFAMAMATSLARRGDTSVRVLCHTTQVRDEINAGENKTYLPGYQVHSNITAYTDIADACDPDIQLVLLVIPTQFLRKFLVANLASLPVGCPIVVCAKVRRSSSAFSVHCMKFYSASSFCFTCIRVLMLCVCFSILSI